MSRTAPMPADVAELPRVRPTIALSPTSISFPEEEVTPRRELEEEETVRTPTITLSPTSISFPEEEGESLFSRFDEEQRRLDEEGVKLAIIERKLAKHRADIEAAREEIEAAQGKTSAQGQGRP